MRDQGACESDDSRERPTLFINNYGRKNSSNKIRKRHDPKQRSAGKWKDQSLSR